MSYEENCDYFPSFLVGIMTGALLVVGAWLVTATWLVP